jgi:hypothetical protein
MRQRARPVGALAAVAMILVASTTACDSLLDTSQDYADVAYVRVTGTSSVPLKLVLSNNFVRNINDQGQTTVSLVTADTQIVTLPIDAWMPLGNNLRILARLINADTAVTATIHMRVFLDDEEVYNQQATMRDASLEYYFTYF